MWKYSDVGRNIKKGIIMKLYLKQRVFTFLDSYDIYDANQMPVYTVKRKYFQFPPGFDILSSYGEHIFTVARHYKFFVRSYDIIHNGMTVATLDQRLSFFQRAFDITAATGDVFSVDGDFFAWSFTITKNGMPYASLNKVLLSWGDSYEIDVYDSSECAFATALVIAIDDTFHSDRNK